MASHCRVCGKEIEQIYHKKRRVFCGVNCKQKDFRERAKNVLAKPPVERTNAERRLTRDYRMFLANDLKRKDESNARKLMDKDIFNGI